MSTQNESARVSARAVLGDRVLIRWDAKLDDGQWLEDEIERERPIWVVAGMKNAPMRPMLHGLIGMAVGDKKSVTISPGEAFGIKAKQKVFDVVTTSLPRAAAVGEWVDVDYTFFKGEARVVAKSGGRTTLDANHPHAGRTLHVDVEVLNIEKK